MMDILSYTNGVFLSLYLISITLSILKGNSSFFSLLPPTAERRFPPKSANYPCTGHPSTTSHFPQAVGPSCRRTPYTTPYTQRQSVNQKYNEHLLSSEHHHHPLLDMGLYLERRFRSTLPRWPDALPNVLV